MNTINLTKSNFSDYLNKDNIIVIDFFANWCKPCQFLKKIMKSLAKEYPDVIFAHVNAEQEEELKNDFSVKSVPAVMILFNRHILFARTGVLSKEELKELIDQAKNKSISTS